MDLYELRVELCKKLSVSKVMPRGNCRKKRSALAKTTLSATMPSFPTLMIPAVITMRKKKKMKIFHRKKTNLFTLAKRKGFSPLIVLTRVILARLPVRKKRRRRMNFLIMPAACWTRVIVWARVSSMHKQK